MNRGAWRVAGGDSGGGGALIDSQNPPQAKPIGDCI